MRGRGRITGPENQLCGIIVDIEITASFGEYSRNQNPTIDAISSGASFSFEFATPDEARKLGEKLFELARKAEERSEQHGPEYRARLAREEFKEGFKELVERVEKAVGVMPKSEAMHIMTTPFNATEDATSRRASK